jgi:hypothetical protein
MQVRITGAWFTGDRSFIRAWACFIRLADNFEGTPIEGLPQGWLPSTPLQTVVAVAVESGSSREDDHPRDDDHTGDDGDPGSAPDCGPGSATISGKTARQPIRSGKTAPSRDTSTHHD